MGETGLRRWIRAQRVACASVAGYAIDDQTAIKMVDDTVEVISEGHSKLFAPSPEGS